MFWFLYNLIHSNLNQPSNVFSSKSVIFFKSNANLLLSQHTYPTKLSYPIYSINRQFKNAFCVILCVFFSSMTYFILVQPAKQLSPILVTPESLKFILIKFSHNAKNTFSEHDRLQDWWTFLKTNPSNTAATFKTMIF